MMAPFGIFRLQIGRRGSLLRMPVFDLLRVLGSGLLEEGDRGKVEFHGHNLSLERATFIFFFTAH